MNTRMDTIYPLTLLYDANCAVCSLEMDHLRSLNAEGRLHFVDISAPGFDPTPYGVLLSAMDAEIHARLGWVLRPTAWAPLRGLSDVGYRLFARHRRRISRAAAPLIQAIRSHRARRMAERMRECAGGACEMPEHNNRRPS